ncbi:sensor domain-containing diguanylate cyclase [Geothermobacter hydrogeniphilus]|nr:GGDEF domain-containing protein [Geothermobacter hydrogeniphilus]
MTREQIIQGVMDAGALPTLSSVASKLIEITGREETTIYQISSLVAQDVSLSAKLLKVVNSAFYSFPNEVRTIQQAVAILGTNAVRSLVLSFSFLDAEHARRQTGFDYQRFWEQSLATAVAARMLVEEVETDVDPEEVFTVCLLENIGVLILAKAFPEQYDAVLRKCETDAEELFVLEERELGADHSFVGCHAARHWQFPETLVQPILYHHDPSSYQGGNREMEKVVVVAYLAGLVANILYSGHPLEYADRFRREAKKRLGLKSGVVDQVFENVNREVSRAADYFGLKIAGTPSVPEILQRANIELATLNMSYEQVNRELVEAKLELERLNAELEEKNRYLEQIANLDGLTGIFNHRYFQESLNREMNRAVRTGRGLSLIMIDLDKFKNINDFYGHQAGDFVLKEACRIWGEQLRDYDLLARYGGEEFIVILPETDVDEALVVAEKLRQTTAGHEFDNGGERYSVTASFGVAAYDPVDVNAGRNLLIEQADTALYAAKEGGRNRVERYVAKKAGWLKRLKG